MVEGTIAAGSVEEDKGERSLGRNEADVTAEERNSYHADAGV